MSDNIQTSHLTIVASADEPTDQELLEIARKWLHESQVTEPSAQEALQDREFRDLTVKRWEETEGKRRREEREKAERQREFEKQQQKKAGLERLKTFARKQVFGEQAAVPSPVELLIKAGSAGTLPSTILAEEKGRGNDLKEEVKKKFGVVLPFAVYGDMEHANASRYFFIRCIKDVREKLRGDQIAPEEQKNLEGYKRNLQRHIDAVNFVFDAGHGVKDPRTLPYARQEIQDEMDKVCAEILRKSLSLGETPEETAMRQKREAEDKARDEAQKANRLAALNFLQKGNEGLAVTELEGGAKRIAKAMQKNPGTSLKEAAKRVFYVRVNEIVNLPLDKEDKVATEIESAMLYARPLGIPKEKIEKMVNSQRGAIVARAERQRADARAVSTQPVHIGAMEGSGGGKNKPTGEKKPRPKGHGGRKK